MAFAAVGEPAAAFGSVVLELAVGLALPASALVVVDVDDAEPGPAAAAGLLLEVGSPLTAPD
jgi:hypothetical protein